MFTYLKEPSAVERILPRLLEEPLTAYDTETTGLDHHVDKVILASISTPKETFVIDTRDVRNLKVLKPYLEKEDNKKLGHHLQFDYVMTKGTADIELEGSVDTYLGERLLGAGVQWDGFSLEDITLKYIQKQRDKTLQTSFVGHKGEFSQEQLQYAAEDTADLFPVAEAMKDKIMAEGLGKVWGIENRALAAFADIYYYGLKIDQVAWHKIMDDYSLKLKDAEKNLSMFYEPFFDRDLFGELHINFASQPTILYGLQRMGIQVEGRLIQDTNDMTRKKISDKPVIKALDAYREAQKALGTYGQPYLDAIHPVTGRIHPKINQLGTDTGRPTCPKPNVLNIPQEQYFRHAFVTDEGRLISTVDFSGAELRIIADQSGDPLMVAGFNSGVDFHCYVAAMLFNRDKVDKKDPIRTPVKNLNFGLAYGMGPQKLYDKLNGMGHKISLDECKDLFRKYKSTFTVAIAWLERNRRAALRDLAIANILGRKRRWLAPNYYKVLGQVKAEVLKKAKKLELTEEQIEQCQKIAEDKIQGQRAAIEREGGNHPVQSTNVEWTKEAMYEIRKECKKKSYDARFYNSVYDETVLDIAEKDAQEVHELQKKIMIQCGQKYCKRVPVEVEGHLEPYWTK
jgi:DNA polymerase I-like protein with 3'-5' exonuclease and polymerase domains